MIRNCIRFLTSFTLLSLLSYIVSFETASFDRNCFVCCQLSCRELQKHTVIISNFHVLHSRYVICAIFVNKCDFAGPVYLNFFTEERHFVHCLDHHVDLLKSLGACYRAVIALATFYKMKSVLYNYYGVYWLKMRLLKNKNE